MDLYFLNDFLLCAMDWPEPEPIRVSGYGSNYSTFVEELREMGLDPVKMFTLNPLIFEKAHKE